MVNKTDKLPQDSEFHDSGHNTIFCLITLGRPGITNNNHGICYYDKQNKTQNNFLSTLTF